MSESPGSWSETEVAGHPCDIYEPPERCEEGFVVLYLHGVNLNRLVDKPAFVEQFAKHGLRVIVPITQRSWWADRICSEFDLNMTAERHVLDNVLPEIQNRWEVTTPKIGLMGTSMGGQGALRLAYKHPNVFPVVAAISPAIDYYTRFGEGDQTLPKMYDDPEAARQDSAILHIHPLNWPRNQWFCCDPKDYRWYDSSDRMRMKLGSLGVPYECDLDTSGGGHGFEYYSRMAPAAVEFIVDRLRQEQRRLV
jgi:S-formylglutathione hydrolase FrmB